MLRTLWRVVWLVVVSGLIAGALVYFFPAFQPPSLY